MWTESTTNQETVWIYEETYLQESFVNHYNIKKENKKIKTNLVNK